jgi:cob(I)alamin adenosyltransferase
MKKDARNAIHVGIQHAKNQCSCVIDTGARFNSMKIYTKTGDLGDTGLFSGKRVSKSEYSIEANGALDEATSYIGWAREQIRDEGVRNLLTQIQHDLYEIMGYLAGAKLESEVYEKKTHTLETKIDEMTAILPPLTRFILPQGGELATRLHIARTSIRSAERSVVRYVKEKSKYTDITSQKNDLVMVKYLNRLSDLFFTLARQSAQDEKVT